MEFLLVFFGYLKKNVYVFAGKRLLVTMGWLTKILKGSSRKYSDGQANRRYNREDRSSLDTPRYSAVYMRELYFFFFYVLVPFHSDMTFLSSGRI